MQDVSCEPLMLCPSENPQASLDIFSPPHHHPSRSCIHLKAINKDKPLVLLDVSILTRIERIGRMAVVEIDQKVCCFPQAYALAA